MSGLRLVFMGTPVFALPSLELLRESRHRITVVVTRPDRPRGRGKQVGFSPVKEWALRGGVELWQPPDLTDPAFRRRLAEAGPELIITAAYGRILPLSMLRLPPLGCINLHASLLPLFRGAAPIHRAVITGASETGVTVMAMAPELDAGDILMQQPVPVLIDDTSGSLHDRLAEQGASLLLRAVDGLAGGTVRPVPQDHAAATFAPPLRPAEEALDWRRGALALYNQVRGMNPWPGAYTVFDGKRLKVWRAKPPAPAGPAPAEPGTVLEIRGEAVQVAAGDGALELLEVQPAGKRPMTAAAFCRGRRVTPGCRLGFGC